MALNSLIVATIATAGSLLVSVLAAYAFSRLRFPWPGPIFVVMLSALMIPGQMTVIPVFILMRNLHLIDTPAVAVDAGADQRVRHLLLPPVLQHDPSRARRGGQDRRRRTTCGSCSG